jgi:hypothetical protein
VHSAWLVCSAITSQLCVCEREEHKTYQEVLATLIQRKVLRVGRSLVRHVHVVGELQRRLGRQQPARVVLQRVRDGVHMVLHRERGQLLSRHGLLALASRHRGVRALLCRIVDRPVP